MSNRKNYIKEATLEWLLEDNNPSVKYFTLIDLMDKKPNSSAVKSIKDKIMVEGPVPKILAKQKPRGYWEDFHNFYLPKFKATVHSFYILVELAADGNDNRIKRTCEFILEQCQDKPSGAFYWKKGNLNIIPCLTGNMLFSLIRCGYINDPRVQKGIDWIVKYQRFDDGETKPTKEWPYNAGPRKGDSCWGKHSCHTGVICALKALSEIPKAKRSKEIKLKIEQASEYFLEHHIYKRSHDLSKISIRNWIYSGFPLGGFLQVLYILSKLGYKDNRMQDAIDLLFHKQNENGRWVMEVSLNGRMHANIEKKGKESKWVTLNALRSLKFFYS